MPKRKPLAPATPSPVKPGPRTVRVEAAVPDVDGTFGDVVVADALRELSTRDPKLGELIARCGELPRIFACQEARRAKNAMISTDTVSGLQSYILSTPF